MSILRSDNGPRCQQALVIRRLRFHECLSTDCVVADNVVRVPFNGIPFNGVRADATVREQLLGVAFSHP